MAIYPKAVYKPLTVPRRAEANSPITMSAPRRINAHTAVSNSYSLAWDERRDNRAGFFNMSGADGVFSHFYIREDGVVEQMQDTRWRSTCDLDGNPDTISIESWDGYGSDWSGGDPVPAYNDAQRAAMVDLVAWLLAVHPSIPPRMATTNTPGPGSWGLSWHRLGIKPTAPNPNGLIYSNAYGKQCPGDAKIGQLPGILHDALHQEEDMALSDDDIKRIWAHPLPWVGGKTLAARLVPYWLTTRVDRILSKLGILAVPDVDEEGIAASVVEQLAPDLRAAVADVVRESLDGVSDDAAGEIADQVVSKLGTKLNA